MAAGLVDIEGNVHRESSVPTNHSLDRESLYADLVGLVESVLRSDVSYDVCGVGCGGPMSPGDRKFHLSIFRHGAISPLLTE